MEINLGTENQKPLPSFKNVEIFRASNFKLLGPIKSFTGDDIRQTPGKNKPPRNFTSWARGAGDWPSTDKDPFIFIHKIRNKDVSKLKIDLLVEALFDTVDAGSNGKSEDMGMTRVTTVQLRLKYGLENSNVFVIKDVTISGSATSPFSYTLGESADSIGAFVQTFTEEERAPETYEP